MSEVLAVPTRYRPASPLPYVEMDEPLSPRRSCFETLAQSSRLSPPQHARTLDVLLAACCTSMRAGPAVLQPIWAEEAMHRACMTMRLLRSSWYPAAIEVEQNLARDLAALFQSMDAPPDKAAVSCSRLVRDIAADLVALFAVGDVTLRINIQPLHLPAYKRRALVLATAELVMNTLLHAFSGRGSGHVEVTLCLLEPTRARLRVKDDGVGFLTGQPNLHCGIAAGLAGILEADLCYIKMRSVTIAEIVFPINQA